jgi:hypothetical protein
MLQSCIKSFVAEQSEESVCEKTLSRSQSHDSFSDDYLLEVVQNKIAFAANK